MSVLSARNAPVRSALDFQRKVATASRGPGPWSANCPEGRGL